MKTLLLVLALTMSGSAMAFDFTGWECRTAVNENSYKYLGFWEQQNWLFQIYNEYHGGAIGFITTPGPASKASTASVDRAKFCTKNGETIFVTHDLNLKESVYKAEISSDEQSLKLIYQGSSGQGVSFDLKRVNKTY